MWERGGGSAKIHTVRAEIVAELILERAGPVICMTFLLVLITAPPDLCLPRCVFRDWRYIW